MLKKEVTLNYKKKMRVHVSKSLNTIKSWDIIGPLVSEQVTGSEYTPVPYLIDTYAYQIGHIFVEEPLEVQCFCAAPVWKVLGPIRDFIVRKKSDAKWQNNNLHAIKSTGKYLHFNIEIESGKNALRFKCDDCFFLKKPADMKIVRNVTIDRSTHDDLSRAEWFGLITDVFVTGETNLLTVRNQRERTLLIGEKPHTVLFKYETCRIDDKGAVYETSTEKMECKWLPVQERDMDALPLTKFVSQTTRTK